MKKIIHVVGARPNFMKVAPVLEACQQKGLTQLLVHTGQHYDAAMSDVFFKQLGIPEPDINLGVGAGTHAQQTAQVMLRFEEVVEAQKPSLVVVYGDVNSTLAATLVCAKLGVPVAHVEAGLRCYDNSMPEEINRVVVDHLASVLLTSCEDAKSNLVKEGIDPSKILFVGNVMIDTLLKLKPLAQQSKILDDLAIKPKQFILATLHRPSNVDQPVRLAALLSSLERIGSIAKVIFPAHPRTRERIKQLGVVINHKRIHVIDPLGYVDFIKLQMEACGVITDSGGVQEETTILQTPCLTFRPNTERPITLTKGTNHLIGEDCEKLEMMANQVFRGYVPNGTTPLLWDGKAAVRIASILGEL